jgi:hypothetical protein
MTLGFSSLLRQPLSAFPGLSKLVQMRKSLRLA